MIIGNVHSIQSLGTVDGPGIRYVVFLMGCPLRCGCCHNPDTRQGKGKEYTAKEIVENAVKYKEYFESSGGVTFSGGEPLLQADYAYEVFTLLKQEGINTCLDTSGCILNDSVKELLKVTDRVLLDIKYTDDELYKKYVGCRLKTVIEFLEYLNKNNIPTTIRQVIIPGLNDKKENVSELKKLVSKYSCVDKIELLPFKKICQTKYDSMGIEFPFKDFSTPTNEQMTELNKIIKPL